MTRIKIIIYSLLIQIAAIIITNLFAAGGHGTYIPFRVFFPYTMLSTVFYEDIRSPFIIIMFFQYILYGIVLYFTFNTKYLKNAFSFLAFCHIFSMLIGFIYMNEYFV